MPWQDDPVIEEATPERTWQDDPIIEDAPQPRPLGPSAPPRPRPDPRWDLTQGPYGTESEREQQLSQLQPEPEYPVMSRFGRVSEEENPVQIPDVKFAIPGTATEYDPEAIPWSGFSRPAPPPAPKGPMFDELRAAMTAPRIVQGFPPPPPLEAPRADYRKMAAAQAKQDIAAAGRAGALPYTVPEKTPQELAEESNLERERLRAVQLGPTVESMVAGLRRTGRGLAGVGARVAEQVLPFGGNLAQELGREAPYMEQAAAANLPGAFPRAVRGITGSTSQMAVGALGGPLAIIGLGMATEANSAFSDAKGRGLSDRDARNYAVRAAVIEGAPAALAQAVGLGGAEALIAGGRAGARELMRQLAAELGEEVVTEVLHSVNAAVSSVDPTALKPENLWETIKDTTYQTAGTLGLIGGVQRMAAGPAPLAQKASPPENLPEPFGEPIRPPAPFDWSEGLNKENLQKVDPFKVDPEDAKDYGLATLQSEAPPAPVDLDHAMRELEENLNRPPPLPLDLEPEVKAPAGFVPDPIPQIAPPPAPADPELELQEDKPAEIPQIAPELAGPRLPPWIPRTVTPKALEKRKAYQPPGEKEPEPFTDPYPTRFKGATELLPARDLTQQFPPSPPEPRAADVEIEAATEPRPPMPVQAPKPELPFMPRRGALSRDPDIAFKLTDEEGRPQLAKEHVERIFPGTTVEELGPHSHRVTFQNGKHFDIQQVPKIAISDQQWAQAKAGYPDLTDDMRDTIKAAGSLEIGGTGIDGLALMRLAKGYAEESTLRHESLHLARRIGLFGEPEWNALVERYSSKDAGPQQQEEDIASAREAWTGEGSKPGVLSKIASWARGILERAGILKPKGHGVDAQAVEKLMDSAEFWRREQKIDPQGRKFTEVTFKGRPDLANPNIAPEARAFADKIDSQMKEHEVRSDEEVQASAKKILDNPRRTEALKKRMSQGETLSDSETAAARSLTDETASKAMATGDLDDILEAVSLHVGYREGGTEQARAFRARRDSVETPAQRRKRALQAAVMTPSNTMYKLIMEERAKAKKSGDYSQVKALERKAAREAQKMRETLGLTPEQFEKASKDHQLYSEILRAISTKHSTYWDKQYEWWNNAILSGPETSAVNVLSTPVNAIWYYGANRGVQALINSGVQSPKGMQWGEIKHILKGVLPGVSKGLRNAMMAWKTEMPYFEESLGRKLITSTEESHAAIGGKTGRFVRSSWRSLNAADAFNKSVIAQMEVGAQAFRQGKAKGLKNEALERYIAEQVSDTNSEAWDPAVDLAQTLAYQQKGGEISQNIKKGLGYFKKVPGARYVAIPFINTPVNIVGQAIEDSPLGSAGVLADILTKKFDLKSPETQTKLAGQIIAWGMLMAIAGRDDDEITGNVTQKFGATGKREMQYRTGQPRSVRVGDTWFDYGRLGHHGIIASAMVDVLRAPEDEGKFVALANSVSDAIGNNTFMRSFQQMRQWALPRDETDFYDATTEFASSFIPNLYKQGAKGVKALAGEPIPERRVWGKDAAEKTKQVFKRAIQKTEIPWLAPDQPKIDVYGETAQFPGGTGLSPVKTKPFTPPFLADKIISNWNKQNPGKEFYPTTVAPWINIDREKVFLGDEQRTELAKVAGEEAKRMVLGKKFSSIEHPTPRDLKILKKVFEKARKKARAKMKIPDDRDLSAELPEEPDELTAPFE